MSQRKGSVVFFGGGDVFSYMNLNKAIDWKGGPLSKVIELWREKKVLIGGQSAGTMIMGKNNNMSD